MVDAAAAGEPKERAKRQKEEEEEDCLSFIEFIRRSRSIHNSMPKPSIVSPCHSPSQWLLLRRRLASPRLLRSGCLLCGAHFVWVIELRLCIGSIQKLFIRFFYSNGEFMAVYTIGN